MESRPVNSHNRDTVVTTGYRTAAWRWLLVVGALFVVLAGIGAIAMARKWPFTQEAITKLLQDRLARTVNIQTFSRTYFPPGCIAEKISFADRVHKDAPLITVRKLIVRGSYSGLVGFHKSVPEIQVIGLHVLIPPKRKDGKSRSIMPLNSGKSNTLGIEEIKTNDAVLEFLSNDPAKEPFRLELHDLFLKHIGSSVPISFETALHVTKPPGEIRAKGQFGPWNQEDSGSTPVSGSYTLADAKLGVFKGVTGTVSSAGKFEGTLELIRCQGTADVPNFQVKNSKHVVHLSTTFHADVDAANGDTHLLDVRSRLLHTAVLSEGNVSGRPGSKGKIVALDMTVKEGRIDDLLKLATGQKDPSMTGPIALHAKVEVPSDGRPFLQKLTLMGDFGIGGAKLTNPKVQVPINKLSESANGESKKDQAEDPRTVLSNIKGHVFVKNGIATLSNISGTMPGAFTEMRGTFNLLTKAVDIKGVLHTIGKLSDTTSGFKAMVLKVAGPFLKRKSVTIVPFTIKGTSAHPTFALDFAGKGSLEPRGGKEAKPRRRNSHKHSSDIDAMNSVE